MAKIERGFYHALGSNGITLVFVEYGDGVEPVIEDDSGERYCRTHLLLNEERRPYSADEVRAIVSSARELVEFADKGLAKLADSKK